MIVRKAANLLPESMEDTIYDVQMSWCVHFKRRNGLTLRRITNSGRKTRSGLEEAHLGFDSDVLKVVMKYCFDPRFGLIPKRTIFNMDQTSVYYNMGCRDVALR
ncbi:DNA binding [Phytophthora ramorum]